MNRTTVIPPLPGKDSVERRLRINALLVGETGLDKTGLLLIQLD
ncbi:MAG: hypothetical protein WBF33_27460 [Candidatus Nitrosopolaris sp.]